MKTLKQLAAMAAIAVTTLFGLASCNDKNAPEMPNQNNNASKQASGQNYTAHASLLVNDSAAAFIQNVQVRITLPGGQEQVEQLSFRPLNENDKAELFALNNVGLAQQQFLVAAIDKPFKQKGEVKMKIEMTVDSLRPTTAEKYDLAVTPFMEVKANNESITTMRTSISMLKGLPAEKVIPFLLKHASLMDENTFEVK